MQCFELGAWTQRELVLLSQLRVKERYPAEWLLSADSSQEDLSQRDLWSPEYCRVTCLEVHRQSTNQFATDWTESHRQLAAVIPLAELSSSAPVTVSL